MISKSIFLIVSLVLFSGCAFSNFKQEVKSQFKTIKKDIKTSITVNDKKSDLTSFSRQNVGTIVSLSSDIFSKKNVKQGFYGPYGDSNHIPFGLFFLKQYDPNKKIVLFVHGISGSPTQFSYLINNLDKDKYQVLLAFYPSGFKLQKLGKYLDSLLVQLQNKLHFKKISIVAHSMGGLVSKSIINNQIKSANLMVDSFISISTPWGGHKAANFGVKYTPIVIPVWTDMAQGSDFLKDIYQVELPMNFRHYLVFGFKGKSLTAEGNSDGVISINSQLRLIVQDKASIVKGYNENHTSILKNKNMSNFVNKILDENNKIN